MRAFTLVELLIVTVIIGILSVVAIPSYLIYRQKTYKAEAFIMLGHIRQSQIHYRNEVMLGNGAFGDSLEAVQFHLEGAAVGSYRTKYWQYEADENEAWATNLPTTPVDFERIRLRYDSGAFVMNRTK